MYIKDDEYEQIAFIIMRDYLIVEPVLNAGEFSPKRFDFDDAIDGYLPDKYTDEACAERSEAVHNYWTKHNDRKLKKYIQTEITRRKLIFTLNINHIKDISTKKRMNTCNNILTR